MLRRRRHCHATQLNLVADHRRHRRTGAAEGHAHQIELGRHLEQFRREIGRGADTRRADAVLLVVFLDQHHQFLHGLRGYRRMRDKHIGRSREIGYRHEALERIVRNLRVERGIDHVARTHHRDGVAVGQRYHGVGDVIAIETGFAYGAALAARPHFNRRVIGHPPAEHIDEVRQRIHHRRRMRIALQHLEHLGARIVDARRQPRHAAKTPERNLFLHR